MSNRPATTTATLCALSASAAFRSSNPAGSFRNSESFGFGVFQQKTPGAVDQTAPGVFLRKERVENEKEELLLDYGYIIKHKSLFVKS